MPNTLLVKIPRPGTGVPIVPFRGCRFRADEDVLYQPSAWHPDKWVFFGYGSGQGFYVDSLKEAERVDQDIVNAQKAALKGCNWHVCFTDASGAEHTVNAWELDKVVPISRTKVKFLYNDSRSDKLIEFESYDEAYHVYSMLSGFIALIVTGARGLVESEEE